MTPLEEASGGTLDILFEKTDKSGDSKKYQISSRLAAPNIDMLSGKKPFTVMFFIETPNSILRNLKWDISGDFSWNEMLNMKSSGQWNEQAGNFTLLVRNNDGSLQLHTELLTPFTHYERLKVSLGLENFEMIGVGKVASAEFFKSGWTSPIKLGVEYRYRFDGFLDMEGEINVVSSSLDLPPLHAELRSTALLEFKKYNGVIRAHWGTFEPKVEINADINEDQNQMTFDAFAQTRKNENVTCRLEFMRPEEGFHIMNKITFREMEILLLKLTHDLELAYGVVKIATPWGQLESTANVVPLTSFIYQKKSISMLLHNTNVSLGFSFASKKILQLELVSRPGKRVIEIYNPIRPISLSVNQERIGKENLKVKIEACWNIYKPNGSTLGLEFIVAKRAGAGSEYGVSLQAAKYGFFKMKVNHLFTVASLNHIVKTSWDFPSQMLNGKFGYSVNLDHSDTALHKTYDLTVHIDFPRRSFVLKTLSNEYDQKEMKKDIQLWWDYERDETKFLALRIDRAKTSEWGGYKWDTNVTVTHSALVHPFVLTCNRAFQFNRLKFMSLSFQATALAEEKLVFTVSKPNTEWDRFEMNLNHAATQTNITVDFDSTNEDVQTILFSFMTRHGETKKLKFIQEEKIDLTDVRTMFTVQTFGNDEFHDLLKTTLISKELEAELMIKFLELELESEFRSQLPLLKIQVKVDNARKWQMVAGLPHQSEITLKLWREISGMNIHDFTAALKLNASKAISGRIYWRPELLEEMSSVNFKTDVFNVIPLSEYTIPEIVTDIKNEFNERALWLQPGLQNAIESIWEFSNTEFQVMFQEIGRFVNTLGWIYEQDTFYMKTACEFVFASHGTFHEIRSD